jgi:hypothetical protein
MIHEAIFSGLSPDKALTVLNSVQPQFVDPFVREALTYCTGPLATNSDSQMLHAAEQVARQINLRFIRPNYPGKSLPILACTVSEEIDGVNQYDFMIPVSFATYLTIKWRASGEVILRWPSPVWKEFGHLMARLVYGNGLAGSVEVMLLKPSLSGIVEQRFRLSYRAGLVIGVLGPELADPFIDMASDGLLEDFACESSTSPQALGLKKKSAKTYLEL